MRKFSGNFVILLLIVFIFMSMSGCGSDQDSIVGTWVIEEYDSENGIISTDDIGTIYGEMSSEFNKYSLTFTKTGNVTIVRPNMLGDTTELNLAYTIQDGLIEFYDPEDTTNFELYDYKNSRIYIEISNDLTAIFIKK